MIDPAAILRGDLPPLTRVLLMGGTSHAGKSTLAKQLATKLGYEYRSTDKLAKHPGRPWSNTDIPCPPHVVEHYASLSVEELLADVLQHYGRNVLPQVVTIVNDRVADRSLPSLVLEGSALLPAYVAGLLSEQVAGVWLTADAATITRRIHSSSNYDVKSVAEQSLISKFFERSIAFDRYLCNAMNEHGMTDRLIVVDDRHTD